MEGLNLALANLTVYIHPSKAKVIPDAILVELNSLLFKYNEKFEGVVLAYEPNLQSYLARILPGLHPYIGVKLQSELLLFNPKPDMIVEGEVVEVTRKSIHAVVLGFSSAFIGDADIREEFRYRRGKEAFRSTVHKKHKIKKGTFIRFIVKSFDEDVLHICGSLLPARTGSIEWLERHDEDSNSESNAKKRKVSFDTREVSALDEVAHDGEPVDKEAPKISEKSKKRKGRSVRTSQEAIQVLKAIKFKQYSLNYQNLDQDWLWGRFLKQPIFLHGPLLQIQRKAKAVKLSR